MLIEVTEADIRNGLRQRCYSCPVALAVQRASGDASAHVDNATAEFSDGGRARLPAAARRWIRDFDAGGPVLPFAFDLPAAE